MKEISYFKAGGADREQRGADHGTETGRSKLPISESRRQSAEYEDR